MAAARNWLNLTVLPDGRVLASGGTATGSTTLTLRYAAGGGGPAGNRTVTVTVNGAAAQTVTLAATADWSTWSTRSVVVDLPAGTSTVAVAMTQGTTGWVDVDAVTVG